MWWSFKATQKELPPPVISKPVERELVYALSVAQEYGGQGRWVIICDTAEHALDVSESLRATYRDITIEILKLHVAKPGDTQVLQGGLKK